MSSKQPSTTTQIQKVELPPWVNGASQDNYKSAVDLSNRPYEAYTGDRVAGASNLEMAAGGTLQNGINGTQSALQQALGSAGKAGSFTPSTVTAGQVRSPGGVADVRAGGFLSRDINSYMDPNIDSVVNSTLSGLDRGIAQGQQGIADSARGVGAWGGSRFGVQQAVYGAEGERNKAATEGSLRSAAYQDAANRIQQDNATALQAAMANQNAGLTTNAQGIQVQTANQQSALQAALANQSAGLAGAGLNLQGGQLALQTGTAMSDTSGRNALLQSQIGASGRALDQAKLDANYQQFAEQRDYPQEQLNLRLAALGMSPYGKTSATTSTGQSGGSSNGLLTGIGAAASILPLLFSDRRVKKNVKRRGKVAGTDLNLYDFEYKRNMGAPGKRTGLMAQDVEKKVPGAVVEVEHNGKKVKAVDYIKAVNGAKRKAA